jgi:hypothetical protein
MQLPSFPLTSTPSQAPTYFEFACHNSRDKPLQLEYPLQQFLQAQQKCTVHMHGADDRRLSPPMIPPHHLSSKHPLANINTTIPSRNQKRGSSHNLETQTTPKFLNLEVRRYPHLVHQRRHNSSHHHVHVFSTSPQEHATLDRTDRENKSKL